MLLQLAHRRGSGLIVSYERVLLLIGSARQPASTSESLGAYLLEHLREKGLHTRSLLIHKLITTPDRRSELLKAVDGADLIILAFPLYADSPPSVVMGTMKLIAEHRETVKPPAKQGLAVIVNCGFPDARNNDTAVAICRRFALESGMEWAGGLALGEGDAIIGMPLRTRGRVVRNVVKSLDLAAAALAAGRPISQEARELMAKPMIPLWAYPWYARVGVMRWAWKRGGWGKLHDRPFKQ